MKKGVNKQEYCLSCLCNDEDHFGVPLAVHRYCSLFISHLLGN